MIIFALFIGAILMLFFGFEMLLVLGLPGIATKMLFFGNLPDIIFGQKIVGGINHTTLMAIPFFVLAAELMARGNIAAYVSQTFVYETAANVKDGVEERTRWCGRVAAVGWRPTLKSSPD